MENEMTNKYKILPLYISKLEEIYPLIVHPDIIGSNFVAYCMQIILTLS